MIFPFGEVAEPLVNNPALGEDYSVHMSTLSDEEVDRIRVYGDRLATKSVLLFGAHDEAQVKVQGARIPVDDESRWIYERMASLTHEINAESYQYDLTGFHESFYYLTYDSAVGAHFNWHLDFGPQTPAPRKLSLILQLSDPSEYDGGDFDIMTPRGHVRTHKCRGIVTAMPSYKIHRVTPVTRGIRRTVAMFAVGPNFR